MLEPELNPIPQSIEKKPSLLRIAIDINQPIFPTTESSQYLAWQEGQLEVGDLHANALKLFYFLNFHQILTVTSEEYTNFKNIYYQKNLTKEDIESFNTIINNAKLGDVKTLLVFIGDELADRGLNDYFVLKIFERLHKAGIKFDILLSNHGLNFMRAFEEGTLDRCMMGGPGNVQDISKLNLAKLIQQKIITQETIDDLVKENYLPHVVPANLALDPHYALLSTHAPVEKDVIDAMVKRLQINTDKFPESWSEGEQLAAKVEIANALFQVYVKHELVFHELINQQYEFILGGMYPQQIHNQTKELSGYVFEYLAWSRQNQFTKEKRPQNLSDKRHYATVHGHDATPCSEGTVYNLDNILGKSEQLHCHNPIFDRNGDSHYTVLYSPQQQLMNYLSKGDKEILETIIRAHISELENTLSAKKAEKEAVTNLQKLLQQAYQVKNRWETCTRNLQNYFSQFDNATSEKKKNLLIALKEQVNQAKTIIVEMQSLSTDLKSSLSNITDNTKTQNLQKSAQDYVPELEKNVVWIADNLHQSAQKLTIEEIGELIVRKESDLLASERETAELLSEFEEENEYSELPENNQTSSLTTFPRLSMLNPLFFGYPTKSQINSNALTEQLENLNVQNKTLTEKLEATNKEKEKLHKENTSLQAQANEISVQNQKIAAENTRLKTDLEKVTAEKTALEEKLSSVKIQLKGQNIIIKGLANVVANYKKLQKANEDILLKNNEIQAKLTTAEQTINAASEANKKLQKELNDSETEHKNFVTEQRESQEKEEQRLIEEKRKSEEKKEEQLIHLKNISDVNHSGINANAIKTTALNGDEILDALQKISICKPTDQKKSLPRDWIVKQKARAALIVQNSLDHLDLKEILKLHDLVAQKHDENSTNFYRFIRREQGFFRCDYGNTRTWQTIMEAIKSRLTTLGTTENFNQLESLDKLKFCQMMKTHTVHDGGFGFFRNPVISQSIQQMIHNYENNPSPKPQVLEI